MSGDNLSDDEGLNWLGGERPEVTEQELRGTAGVIAKLTAAPEKVTEHLNRIGVRWWNTSNTLDGRPVIVIDMADLVAIESRMGRNDR